MIPLRSQFTGLIITPALLVSACFSPTVSPTNNDTDGGSDVTGTDSNTQGNTGDSAVDTGRTSIDSGETGTGEGNASPVIELTLNGSDANIELTQAGAVIVGIDASDIDGEVVRTEVSLGETLIAEVDGPPGDLGVVEWIFSGAEMNGPRDFLVTVRDNDGGEASAGLTAVVMMPNGGRKEDWTYDGGVTASAYAIATTPDGDQVAWVGQTIQDGDSVFRADRVVGPVWNDKVVDSSKFAAGVVLRSDESWVAASTPTANGNDTSLIRFSADGSQVAESQVDAGTPLLGADTSDYPIALRADGADGLYVLGSYLPTTGPNANRLLSYLLKSTPGLDTEWLLRVSEEADVVGLPFVHDIDVDGAGNVLLAGVRGNGESENAWIGKYSPGGVLEGQFAEPDYDRSIAYSAAWTGDGGIVVVGTVGTVGGESSTFRAWTRRYDSNLSEQWSQVGATGGSFTEAVAVDDFGRIVTITTEGCEFDAVDFVFSDCDLVASKLTDAGTSVWNYVASTATGMFNGPVLFLPGFKADVTFDRFGYVYFSAQHKRTVGNETRSEWWAEMHHP